MTRRTRIGIGWVAALWGLVCSPEARAWYFPEHAELTRLALRDFAPGFVTESLGKVMAEAASEGLRVCNDAIAPLASLGPRGPSVECVPYGVLAALAGDHANTSDELRRSLRDPVRRWPFESDVVGALLTAAARDTWVDFQEEAPPEALRIWTMDIPRLAPTTLRLPKSASPRNYVRDLDAKLLAIDTGYVSRAKNAKTHFHDPTADIDTTIGETVAGNLDNALAQVLAHHMRSLVLAVRSRGQQPELRRALRVDALLEHAFALHFLEDGFAAGHIATDPAVAADERRAQRHDYFNRQGLAITRALSERRCNDADIDIARSMGLSPCWTAHGDGFATAIDRIYVGEAAARLQTSLALALEGLDEEWISQQLAAPACRSWSREAAPDRSCDVAWTAMLLDPEPRWTTSGSPTGRDIPAAGELVTWCTRIVHEHVAALRALRTMQIPVAADAGRASGQPGTLPIELVTEPDVRRLSVLLRPALVVWPEARADVVTLDGSDQFGRGWNLQVVTNTALSWSDPAYDSAVARAWAGLGGGLAYNAQGIFPHRRTRALLETNIGVAEGMQLAGDAERFRTVLVGEVRAPLTTALLYAAASIWHARQPLGLVGRNYGIGLFGGRIYMAAEDDSLLLSGWDAEVLNAVLDNVDSARSATGAGLLDTELRGRIGWRAKQSNAKLGSMFGGSFFVSVEVSSGFFASVL